MRTELYMKNRYITNSTTTVIKGTMIAGRIYDKIDDVSFAEVKFIANDSVIAKVLTQEEIKNCLKHMKTMNSLIWKMNKHYF